MVFRTFRRAKIVAGKEEDEGGLTPTKDDDEAQRLFWPPESILPLVKRW